MAHPARAASGWKWMAISEVQQKFDYYVVALDFTLLAASIQTASFGASLIRDGLELASWALLLAAGLLALWRLSWMHVAEAISHDRQQAESKRHSYVEARQAGTKQGLGTHSDDLMPIEELIDNFRKREEHFSNEFKSLDDRMRPKLGIAKICFVAGIIALVASRAYLPAATMLHASAECPHETERNEVTVSPQGSP